MFESSTDLANYLAPNERVLWEGRGRRRLTATSTSAILFIGLFAAMALLFLVLFSIRSSPGPSGRTDIAPFIILPLLFLVIGVAVGVPLYFASHQTANARYVVTTSAAMIVSRGMWTSKRVTVIPLRNMPQIAVTENRDGTGTLTFGSSPFTGYGRYSSGWLMDSIPAFWNIERPLEVYQLIRKQMSEQ